MMWHHRIGAGVTRYNPYSIHIGLAKRAREGYGYSDNDIHPRHLHSHQLWASEIPSVESPVMSRNMAQAGQLREKMSPLMWLNFFP